MRRNKTAKLKFERCRELFYYEEGRMYHSATGKLARQKSTKTRYPIVSVDKSQVLEHCVIWLLFNESLPEALDHINEDRWDNRIENLRAANKSLNEANTGPRKTNKLGLKGVRYHVTKRFTAQIQDGPKARYLGSFRTKEEAAFVYNIEAFKKWGMFAYLNPIILTGNEF